MLKWDKNKFIETIYNLIQNTEIITNGYRTSFLSIIYIVSVLLTILIIISKNPIVSVLFLIGLFFSIACYLMFLGINFVGLSYLLVYIGAVSILFLFILMLINVRVSELVTDSTNSIPLVLIISILFSYPSQQTLPLYALNIHINNFLNKIAESLPTDNTGVLNYYASHITNKTFFVSSKLWDGNLAETTHITSIGNIMYTSYSIWLIITSIILLLAMVGTIIITIKKINIVKG